MEWKINEVSDGALVGSKLPCQDLSMTVVKVCAVAVSFWNAWQLLDQCLAMVEGRFFNSSFYFQNVGLCAGRLARPLEQLVSTALVLLA